MAGSFPPRPSRPIAPRRSRCWLAAKSSASATHRRKPRSFGRDPAKDFSRSGPGPAVTFGGARVSLFMKPMEAIMNGTMIRDSHYDVAILGAGYAGLMAALHRGGSRQKPLRVALVNAEDHFVERARLQESIVRPVAPRIPSIAALVAGTGTDFIQGQIASLAAVA